MKLKPFVNIKLTLEEHKLLFELLIRLSKIAIITKDRSLRSDTLTIIRAINKRRTKEYLNDTSDPKD